MSSLSDLSSELQELSLSFAYDSLVRGEVFLVCKLWSHYLTPTSELWRLACFGRWPSATLMPGLRNFRAFFLKRSSDTRVTESGPPVMNVHNLYIIIEAVSVARLNGQEVRHTYSEVLPFSQCAELSEAWDPGLDCYGAPEARFLWESKHQIDAALALEHPTASLSTQLPLAEHGTCAGQPPEMVCRWPPASATEVSLDFVALWCAASEKVVFLASSTSQSSLNSDISNGGTLSNFCWFGFEPTEVWGAAYDRLADYVYSLEPDWGAMELRNEETLNPKLDLTLSLSSMGVELGLAVTDGMWETDDDETRTSGAPPRGSEVRRFLELMWWE